MRGDRQHRWVTPAAPTPKPATQVKGVQVLPRTGNNALPLAELGFGLLLMGVGLTLISRRQLRTV
jgi:LPXTG-motif cell wall-anchored protein